MEFRMEFTKIFEIFFNRSRLKKISKLLDLYAYIICMSLTINYFIKF